jgi:hypothetical protein
VQPVLIRYGVPCALQHLVEFIKQREGQCGIIYARLRWASQNEHDVLFVNAWLSAAWPAVLYRRALRVQKSRALCRTRHHTRALYMFSSRHATCAIKQLSVMSQLLQGHL